MVPLEEGEGKTHYLQQHKIFLNQKKIKQKKKKKHNNDHGVDVHIIIVI
jgi:hypothetical protein